MSWKEIIKKCLNVASAPIRRNANFFVFMYLLGMISSIVTTPAKGTLYDNLVHLPQEGALGSACRTIPYII